MASFCLEHGEAIQDYHPHELDVVHLFIANDWR